MSKWQPGRYKDYDWIVADPELLGGTLAIRGTRLSVSLILECLSNGMSLEDIPASFAGAFPPEALPAVLRRASYLPSSFPGAASSQHVCAFICVSLRLARRLRNGRLPCMRAH